MIEEFLRLAPGVPIKDRSLEDCLTFLDKADVAQEVVAGTGPKNAPEPYRALLNCIGNVLDAAQDGTLTPFLDDSERKARRNPSPMKRLGKFLTERAIAGERDRWSVVSTNWDTTLDRALGRGPTAPVVDYCTYTTPWSALLPARRRARRRHGRGRSLRVEASSEATHRKVPRASRLAELALVPDVQSSLRQSDPEYRAARTAPSGLSPCRRVYCPECRPRDGTTDTVPLLREVLVTPTMIKRLDMVHLKMIWYNAIIEISEARRVVFVGYSAPAADYEVRYMLAKAFASGNRGREVRVVTTPGRCDAATEEKKKNYQRLIGGKVQLFTDGVETLVNKIVTGASGL